MTASKEITVATTQGTMNITQAIVKKTYAARNVGIVILEYNQEPRSTQDTTERNGKLILFRDRSVVGRQCRTLFVVLIFPLIV